MRILELLLEKVIIRSHSDPTLYAQVDETPAGVEVKFYQRGLGMPAKLVDRGVMDAPFHLVLDRVHQVLNTARE